VRVELDAAHRFNPLDSALASALAASLYRLFQHEIAICNVLLCKATGPHYCTGAPTDAEAQAPSLSSPPLASVYAVHSYASLISRGAILPVSQVHGYVVGGGVALSLNSRYICIACRGTASFGNLSRGVSPILLLAPHLHSISGFAAGKHIYLTDANMDACR
jgi:enoyl-CoA hydratase/carnithine racemase